MDEGANAGNSAELQPGGERRRILVVGDNPDVGSFTAQILEDHGYRISWASSAEEALVQLNGPAGDFDPVFSDVRKPGMGGLTLARDCRTLHPPPPVLPASRYRPTTPPVGHPGVALLVQPYPAP